MKHHMQSIIAPFLVILAIVAGASIIGHLDYEAEIQRQTLRQEMESVWCHDAALGLAPSERAGWPPGEGGYNGSSGGCRQ